MWFERVTDTLRTMSTPTRNDLEAAAIQFFGQMVGELDRPRAYVEYSPEDAINFNIDASRQRIVELDDQLKANIFDDAVTARTEELVEAAGRHLDELSVGDRIFAFQLSARAEREQLALLIHQLTAPATRYQASDSFFDTPVRTPSPLSGTCNARGLTISDVVDRHLQMKRNVRRVKNQIEDTSRVLRWLIERTGPSLPIASVGKDELRRFRDDLARLSTELRGRATSFEDRLTDNAAQQIKSATATRYWGFVRNFFAWAAAEGYAPVNVAADLVLQRRKDEVRRSPEPFSTAELKQLLASPLFQGHGNKRWSTPGKIIRRDQHWWSALIFMFTGVRAGELAQLEYADFDFGQKIPFIYIRPEGQAGMQAKSVKSAASVREVPISAVLMTLGLREFVERQKKRPRVFDSFRFGAGRTSDGLSKFWSRYLHDVGLWKPGRSTHVWRHTVIARLRENEVSQEYIAAVVGHEQGTMTSSYGGKYPLSVKQKTIEQLDYGFDVVAALGGPYEKAKHG